MGSRCCLSYLYVTYDNQNTVSIEPMAFQRYSLGKQFLSRTEMHLAKRPYVPPWCPGSLVIDSAIVFQLLARAGGSWYPTKTPGRTTSPTGAA